jgi:hypothetical protein
MDQLPLAMMSSRVVLPLKKKKEKLNYFTVNTFVLNSREATVSLE